jgi:hypothetical protein
MIVNCDGQNDFSKSFFEIISYFRKYCFNFLREINILHSLFFQVSYITYEIEHFSKQNSF